MSILSLEDPNKIHDIVDDLESVFWVFIYSTIERFSPYKDNPFKDIFDYHTADPESGQCWGGQMKYGCIFGPNLPKFQFGSPYLLELIEKCKWLWHAYHTGLRGATVFRSHPETRAEIMAQHELVKKPSHWVEVFADALRDHDARCTVCASRAEPSLTSAGSSRREPTSRTTPLQTGSENRNGQGSGSSHAIGKRKNCPDEDEPHEVACNLRRSQRLKVVKRPRV